MSTNENPVAKAIYETNTMVHGARAETRKRKNWAYVTPAALEDWAKTQHWENDVLPANDIQLRRLFGTRLDAPVRESGWLFAVWRMEGEPDEEPTFVTDPPGPMIDLDLTADKP